MPAKKYQKYNITGIVLVVLSLLMLILSNKKDDTFITPLLIIGFILLVAGLSIFLYVSLKIRSEKKKFAANPENKLENLIHHHKNDNVVFDFIDSYIHNEFQELNDLLHGTSCIVDYDYSIEKNGVYLIIVELIKEKKNPFGVRVISSNDGLSLVTEKETFDIQDWTKEDVLNKILEIIENEAPKINPDENVNFEIKNSKNQFKIILFFFILGWLGTLTILVLNLLHVMNLWFIIAFPAFFAIIGTIGVIAYFREKFILKDGEYTYVSLVKKQKCHFSDIEKIIFEKKDGALFLKIIFYGRNNKKLMSFIDDGTSFSNGKFIASLNHYGIKYEQNFD
ncbi:MAG: hypothetical protein KH380_02645 [Coprobacillus sp.]|nr:hypothetical protein [Coprobacillus sp.]